jgi:peptidoglycan hydrolase-like protein with peptidoglycan-binding domain
LTHGPVLRAIGPSTQGLLIAAPLDPGTVDGSHTTSPTSPTGTAIRAFQRSHGLPEEGIVTLAVWQALPGV